MKRTLPLLFALATFFAAGACSDETPVVSPPSAPGATTPTAEALVAPVDGDKIDETVLPAALAKKAVAVHNNPTSITACFTRADAVALQVTNFSSGDGCAMAVKLGEGATAKYNIAASAAERASGQKDACCYVAPQDAP